MLVDERALSVSIKRSAANLPRVAKIQQDAHLGQKLVRA
jgi:hypothetical protein